MDCQKVRSCASYGPIAGTSGSPKSSLQDQVLSRALPWQQSTITNELRSSSSSLSMERIKEVLRRKENALSIGKVFILKFTAAWCKPCKRIQHLCLEWQQALGNQVVFLEIDIDEEIDIYSFYKRKRIIRGVPAILAWVSKDASLGHWPEDSVCSADATEVLAFFGRIHKHISDSGRNDNSI